MKTFSILILSFILSVSCYSQIESLFNSSDLNKVFNNDALYKDFKASYFINLNDIHSVVQSDLQQEEKDMEAFEYFYDYYCYLRNLHKEHKLDDNTFYNLERKYSNYLKVAFNKIERNSNKREIAFF